MEIRLNSGDGSQALTFFKKSLHECPAHLQHMILRLQQYKLNICYKKGKDLYLQKQNLTFMYFAHVNSKMLHFKWWWFRMVGQWVKNKWFCAFKEELSIYDRVVFKNDKVVIPRLLCTYVMTAVHQPYLGIEASKCRAWYQQWYWKNDKIMWSMQQQKEPLHPHPVPIRADLFKFE